MGLHPDLMLQQLSAPENVLAIRRTIVRLMRQALAAPEQLQTWQKVHLASAIKALTVNLSIRAQPTAAWLPLCLSDLTLVLHPPAQHELPGAMWSLAQLYLIEELDQGDDLQARVEALAQRIEQLGGEFAR